MKSLFIKAAVGVAAVLTAALAIAAPANAQIVHTNTSIAISRSTIPSGSSARIHGRVTPHIGRRVVYLLQKWDGRWHRVAHTRLNGRSRYSFTVSPPRAGRHAYRVASPRHGDRWRGSRSPIVHLRVAAPKPPPPPQPTCTPGYSPCIPPGPDVDCAGGSGDGPRYIQGPVYVTGSDPYNLDSDGDGIGCES